MLTNPRDARHQVGGQALAHGHVGERRYGQVGERRVAAQSPAPGWAHRPGSAPPGPRGIDACARPPHRADVAQARIFEAILGAEIAELQDLFASEEVGWLGRCDRGIDNLDQPPAGLVRLRGRIGEAQRLLDALHARFL